MRLLVKIFIMFLAVLALLLGLLTAFLTSPFFKYPSDGSYPEPRIGALIWPTIGYPALVVAGDTVEVEMDMRTQNAGAQAPQAAGWTGRITACGEEMGSLSYDLETIDASLGPSNHWPQGDPGGDSEDVWHVRFKIPPQAGRELYDLRVQGAADGSIIAGEQPHALSVTEDNNDNFNFIVLSDIHVHERGNSSLFSHQTDKGIAEDGEPLFFEEAIRQVNLIRPNFVLMLGDYVRGQRRPGELLTEYEDFYQALLRLKVPAFLIPGNHDGYVNEIDGLAFFQKNIGPTYFSFDVGGCHFTCLNTYDWPAEDRVVMNKLFYMEPRKWQGQVLGSGDERNPESYSGELAWAEEDLAAHDSSPLRMMAMHHDPYSTDGGGYSYRQIVRGPIWIGGGGGKGKVALSGMASRHEVAMVMGGHLHKDEEGRVGWTDGSGETIYTCQNPVYFDTGGENDEYPGYRLVQVRGGKVESFAYLNGVSSFPFYDGSVPLGITDLDGLQTPALALQLDSQFPQSAAFDVRLQIENYLESPMLLDGLLLEAPALEASAYKVEGAVIYQILPIPHKPGRVMLFLRASVEKGSMGASAEEPGRPAVAVVNVSVP
jgi:3',5'-cyclic AMP phosphodiesterase CpdA